MHNQWGTVSKIKYVLIDQAPLTGSGLNEILLGAVTKKELTLMAKVLGYKLRGPNAWYAIVKVDELLKESEGTNAAE